MAEGSAKSIQATQFLPPIGIWALKKGYPRLSNEGDIIKNEEGTNMQNEWRVYLFKLEFSLALRTLLFPSASRRSSSLLFLFLPLILEPHLHLSGCHIQRPCQLLPLWGSRPADPVHLKNLLQHRSFFSGGLASFSLVVDVAVIVGAGGIITVVVAASSHSVVVGVSAVVRDETSCSRGCYLVFICSSST